MKWQWYKMWYATHMWGFQHLIEDILNVRKFYAWPSCWYKTILKRVLKCPLCKIKFSHCVKDPSDAEWMVELWRCFTADRNAAKSPLFQDREVDHNPWKYCVVFGNSAADLSDSKNTRFCSASQVLKSGLMLRNKTDVEIRAGRYS